MTCLGQSSNFLLRVQQGWSMDFDLQLRRLEMPSIGLEKKSEASLALVDLRVKRVPLRPVQGPLQQMERNLQ